MTIQNDFLTFAGGAGANVLTQAQYAALSSILANGFQSGVANSAQLNKVWRQSSIMAAVMSAFIVDQSGQPAIDDGTTATLEANLLAAIQNVHKVLSQAQTGTAFTAGGTAPAYTLTPSPAITAYVSGQRFRVAFGSAGTTGSNTLNISGQGAVSLKQYDSNGNLVPAVIPAGLLSDVEYNGSVMVLLDPVAGKTSVVGSARNLKMNLAAAATSATWTADEIIAETSLGGVAYQLASFNKTLNLATTGIGGMDTGTAPVNGYVAIYAAYNPSTGVQGIFACNAATSSGSVYGGANQPAGYTATALISTWPTNSSGQLVAGCQVDRQISVPVVNVLTSSSYAASWTSLGISGAVPPNAKSCCGWLGVGNSTNVGASILVSPTSAGVGYQLAETPIGSTYSVATPFSILPILTAQTIYYQTGGSGGTLSLSINITGYSI